MSIEVGDLVYHVDDHVSGIVDPGLVLEIDPTKTDALVLFADGPLIEHRPTEDLRSYVENGRSD